MQKRQKVNLGDSAPSIITQNVTPTKKRTSGIFEQPSTKTEPQEGHQKGFFQRICGCFKPIHEKAGKTLNDCIHKQQTSINGVKKVRNQRAPETEETQSEQQDSTIEDLKTEWKTMGWFFLAILFFCIMVECVSPDY